MGKNQYTEIDKLFRSKLGEDKLSSGPWNEPTDDIFQAAMEKVNDKGPKKKRRGIWPFFLVGFLGLLGFTSWNALKVDALATTISEMKKEESRLPTTKINNTEVISIASANDHKRETSANEITNKKLGKSKVETKTSMVGSVAPVQQKAKSTTYNRSSNDQAIVPPGNYIKEIGAGKAASASNTALILIGETGEEQEKIVESNNKQVSRNSIDENRLSVNLIPGLIGLLNVEDRIPFTSAFKTSAFNNDSFAENKSGFTFYAYLDLNLNKLRMAGLEPVGYSLTKYDQAYLGYDFGLGALQSINEKFTINYNLGFRRVLNNSLFANEMMYDESKLSVNSDGEMVYDLMMELQTPVGAINQVQSFTVLGGGLQDQAMMQQSTDIKQYFKFISLGVQPRLNVWSSDRLSLFAEAGMSVNYLLAFCQDIDMKMYYHNEMMMHDQMEDHSMNSLNRLSVAATAGLGLEYSFGDHIFSSFKVGSSRSLNSIRHQENTSDEVRTFIDNFGVSLSAGYKF